MHSLCVCKSSKPTASYSMMSMSLTKVMQEINLNFLYYEYTEIRIMLEDIFL